MHQVCRTCLKEIEEGQQFFTFDAVRPTSESVCFKTKLETCIPEMVLDMVKNPFICNNCSIALNVAYKFRTKCLQNEEIIYNYMLQTNFDSNSIDLELIDKKDLKLYDESVDTETVASTCEEISSIYSDESKYTPGCFQQCYTLEINSETIKTESVCIKLERCDSDEVANEQSYNFVNSENEITSNEIKSEQNCDKRYKCGVCGYSSNKSLKLHMKIHINDRSLKCSECSFSTAFKKQMNMHTYQVHGGHNRPFKCANCGYRGATKAHLNRHMSIHTGFKPFKCTICEFSTAYKNNLKDHVSIHVGHKPYKCDRCEFSTSTKQHLTKHMRIHTGDRPYKCSVCGFSSAYQSSLKKHLGMHKQNSLKPYSCPDCDYSTTSKKRLNDHHIEVHIGSRPYKCDRCEYSTAREGNYKQHMKLHSGSKRCAKLNFGSSASVSNLEGNV